MTQDTNDTTTNETPKERFMSFMERKLKREILRYQVGRQMWCPVCDGLLDVRRAISIDVYAGGRLRGTQAYCLPCWDVHSVDIKLRVRQAIDGHEGPIQDLRFEETSSKDLR